MVDGDDPLDREDWRFHAIGRLGGGTASIATEELLTDGTHVGFGLPSAPALLLGMAFAAHQRRIATNIHDLFDHHPRLQGIYPDNHSLLFDYFESAMAEVVFSYSAVEASANELIPDDFVYQVAGRNGRSDTAMTKSDIERKTSLDDKLKHVLPQALGRESPAGGQLWPPYLLLKNLRDGLIHLKTTDRTASGPEIETIWGKLLRIGTTSYPGTAANLIGHFYNPDRRWFTLHPAR